MKSTKSFKNTILNHLRERAFVEPLFRKKFENPKKNIDDCVTYILNQVKKSGCSGFDDDEIYNMAAHYYDEENIEIGNAFNGKVVVNHTPVLTEEEKEEAKQKAINQLIEEEKAKIKNRGKKKVDKKEIKKDDTKIDKKDNVQQNTLF